MALITPISSCKRPSPDDESRSDGSVACSIESTKRQRTLSPNTASPPEMPLFLAYGGALPTSPVSAEPRTTMALKLVIPQEESTFEQQKRAKRHKVDAERWKPKLQRPYPKKNEIKHAYPLKLMRHYHDASTQVESNFVKPRIDKSTRVSRLLERFPLINTAWPVQSKGTHHLPSVVATLEQAQPLSFRCGELAATREAHVELQKNLWITRTEHAQRLAWQSFSRTEQDRIDRGREAMVQSGLFTDDLKMEAIGQWNRLPEWKKSKTGRFAREHEAAR